MTNEEALKLIPGESRVQPQVKLPREPKKERPERSLPTTHISPCYVFAVGTEGTPTARLQHRRS